MASNCRTTSVPLSAEDVTGRSEAWRIELKKRYETTGSRCKGLVFTGRSGTGKSSTLEDLSDLSGHSNQSIDAGSYLEFQISRAVIENEEYFIMDTPGFDPENEESTYCEIARGIQAIQPYVQFVGVLFFTCINAQRFDPFDRKLVTFIRALCGDDYIPNITFVTTFWTAPSPKQQAVFRKQLENLRGNWNQDFNGHAPRTYQHGREYDANGVDTERFLDWFEDRDQIAQHGKDMIARYYGGPMQNNIAPKIVQELAADTPVHETDAGRLLGMAPSAGRAKCSGNSTRDPRTSPAQETLPNYIYAEHQKSESTGWAPNYPEPKPQASTGLLSYIQAAAPYVQTATDLILPLIQHNITNAAVGGGLEVQMNYPGSTANVRFSGDPYSVVDIMRGLGMDPSRANRLRLVSELGIGGTPFSAEWNDSIRRYLQRRS